jgi:hypothetical protein
MKKLIKLEVNTNSTLDNYIKLLKIFPEWESISRDLKLNTLLNKYQKKQQLNITDIKGSNDMLLLRFFTHEIDNNGYSIPIKNSCAIIKSMEFIIAKDRKIEKLALGIEILSTPLGKSLEILYKSNIPLIIVDKIIDGDFKFFNIRESPEIQKELETIIPIVCQ